jgi:ketosteroid isomerase-like protein
MRKSLFFLGALVVSLTLAFVFLQLRGTAQAAANDKADIEALEKRFTEAVIAKDVNAIMACYAPGNQLFVFDAIPPRQYPSSDAYKKDWQELLSGFPGPLTYSLSEQSITVVGDVAYGHNIQTGQFTRKDGSKLDTAVRVTDVYRKIAGKWLIVHEHVSFPVDLDTGKADLLSKP